LVEADRIVLVASGRGLTRAEPGARSGTGAPGAKCQRSAMTRNCEYPRRSALTK
jgi:hypothetical protein